MHFKGDYKMSIKTSIHNLRMKIKVKYIQFKMMVDLAKTMMLLPKVVEATADDINKIELVKDKKNVDNEFNNNEIEKDDLDES